MKKILYSLASLIIITIFIKISVVFLPYEENRNYRELQKIREKTEFCFAVFGDSKNSVKVFTDLIKKINEDKSILFCIELGDLVFSGEKERFKFFLAQIKKIKKPLLTVIGNHEILNNGRANYYKIFGPFYYSFSIGESFFIILDDANGENIDLNQFIWLKRKLEESKKYKYKFIFMHIPLFDPRGKNHALRDLNFAKKLNNIFDKFDITMIFSSHIHGYFKGIWGKTPYIITGGAGAKLDGSDPKHYFYHYIKVIVSKNNVKYKIVKLKNPNFLWRLIDFGAYFYTFWASLF